MMSCGQEVMIVADHTKFGRLALARLCGLEEVQSIVVDSGLADEHRAMLEAAGRGDPRRPGGGDSEQRNDRGAGAVGRHRPRMTAWGARHEHPDGTITDARPGRDTWSARSSASTWATGRAIDIRQRQGGRRRRAIDRNVVANISARHCHLTQADVEVLFGPGYQLDRDEAPLPGHRLRLERDGGGGRARGSG